MPTGATETLTGSRSRSSASLPISRGMVAEKNRFCRFDVSWATMRRIGGRKPRSSIWSASSSTSTSVPDSMTLRLGDVVEQPAGRRNQHVDAARQRLDLRPVADAAEHDGHRHAEMPAVGAEAFGDLAGELAGRSEHQHAAALAQRGPAVGGEAVQDRQGECGRLAGAGLGDAQQVAAGQHARDGLRLDRSGRGVAFVLQRLENRGGKAEFRKVRQWIGLSCGRERIGLRRHSGRPAAPSAASFFETPRVSWAVGWVFSGRSTGGQTGRYSA